MRCLVNGLIRSVAIAIQISFYSHPWPVSAPFFVSVRDRSAIQLMLLTFPITQKWHLNGFHVEQLFNDVVGLRGESALPENRKLETSFL
jgi:hypothetical protein